MHWLQESEYQNCGEKFYFIDLFEAAIRSLQDPTLDGLLYHELEMAQDSEGFRVFEKVNSGFVFESF